MPGHLVGDVWPYLAAVIQQWVVGCIGGVLGTLLGLLDKHRPLSPRRFLYFLLGFLVLSPFQLWRDQRSQIATNAVAAHKAESARDMCLAERDREVQVARQTGSVALLERHRAFRDRLGAFLIDCDRLIRQCINGPTVPLAESLQWVKHVEAYLSRSAPDRSFLARFQGAQEPTYGTMPLGQVSGDVQEMLETRRRVLVKLIEELGAP